MGNNAHIRMHYVALTRCLYRKAPDLIPAYATRPDSRAGLTTYLALNSTATVMHTPLNTH